MEIFGAHHDCSTQTTEAITTFQTIKDLAGILTGADPSIKVETHNTIPQMRPKAGTTIPSQWT